MRITVRTRTVSIMFFCIASALLLPANATTEPTDDALLGRGLTEKIYPFGVYIGEDPDMLYRLTPFEMVVLDVKLFSESQIQLLQDSGTQVYAMVSIAGAEIDTDAYRNYPRARLGRIAHTQNQVYMDPSLPHWRKYVVETRVNAAQSKGVDGLYLIDATVYSTVGSEKKDAVARGVAAILKRIRVNHSELKVIIEDPLAVFSTESFTRKKIRKLVDAISKTQVSFKPDYTAADGGQDTSIPQNAQRRQRVMQKLKTYQHNGINIYTIDFTQSESQKEIAEQRATNAGFTSFVGTRDLDTVLWYGGRTSSFATRPFTNDSVWNTPIESDAVVDSNSEAMVDTIQDSISLNRIFLNVHEWTVPIYYADNSTPTFVVDCTNGCGPGFTGSPGYETAAMPIPDGATPDDTTDGLMTVVNVETGYAYDYFRAEKTHTGWTTVGGFRFDLSDDGVQEISATSTGARGAGFPLMAGLIRRDEILQGYIPHALVMAIDYPLAGNFVWPASAEDGRSEEEYAVPEGARVRLNPEVDVESLGLNRTGTIVARALQDYGAFIGDNSDGLAIYVEGRYAKTPEWENSATGEDSIISIEDLHGLPLDELQVMELGELLTYPYLE